jgi:hypothetical protein
MDWKQKLAEHFGYKSFDELNTAERSVAEWIEKNVLVRAADDDKQFKQYVRRERDAFVRFINDLEWNRPLRTACENLIIAYDQMKERL